MYPQFSSRLRRKEKLDFREWQSLQIYTNGPPGVRLGTRRLGVKRATYRSLALTNGFGPPCRLRFEISWLRKVVVDGLGNIIPGEREC